MYGELRLKKFSRWNNWDYVRPTPGRFVYMRDEGTDEWEIGFCVGEGKEIGLLVADDPSCSWLDCDQWQSILDPVDDCWNTGTPPPGVFVYVEDISTDTWVIGKSYSTGIELLNSPGGKESFSKWQIVPTPED